MAESELVLYGLREFTIDSEGYQSPTEGRPGLVELRTLECTIAKLVRDWRETE
jgi:hypothetical protein